MAQWRAVPTAVWTAVGALAFLAAAGIAVVIGAGLHVWSGPVTPGSPPATSGARPGGSGVVTVPPRTTTAPGSPRSTGPATTPVAALPFVPFAPAAGSPAGAPVTAPAVAPPASGAVSPSHGRALGLLRNVRQLALVGLHELRSGSGVESLRGSVSRLDKHDGDGDRSNAGRHSRHGVGKGHAAERGRHSARHHARKHAGRHDSRHGHRHGRHHHGRHHHGRHHHGHGEHGHEAHMRPYPGHARHYDD